MAFTLDRTVESLARTPGILRATLGHASDFWALRTYGEGTFSPFDVLGHLIEADRVNWMPRLRHILDHGDSRPFPPFDRTATGADAGATVSERLDRFAALRAQNLDDLRALSLTPQTLERRGAHPELGVVTARQLLATWAVHDLHHAAQVAKAMAFQYRDEVGPWSAYLSIIPKG